MVSWIISCLCQIWLPLMQNLNGIKKKKWISFCVGSFFQILYMYSRTSVARTLMARLPGLSRTCSWVPRKKSHSCRFGIIYLWFSDFVSKTVYCVYSLESPQWGDSYEYTQHTFMLKKIEKISLLCLLTWLHYQPSLARTTPVSN